MSAKVERILSPNDFGAWIERRPSPARLMRMNSSVTVSKSSTTGPRRAATIAPARVRATSRIPRRSSTCCPNYPLTEDAQATAIGPVSLITHKSVLSTAKTIPCWRVDPIGWRFRKANQRLARSIIIGTNIILKWDMSASKRCVGNGFRAADPIHAEMSEIIAGRVPRDQIPQW